MILSHVNPTESQDLLKPIMSHEYFVDYLRYEHNFDLSYPQQGFKNKLLRRIYLWNPIQDAVAHHYLKIRRRLEDAEERLSYVNENLERMWGVTLDFSISLDALEGLTKWRNPIKVIQALKKTWEQIPTKKQIWEMYKNRDRTERLQWVDSIRKNTKLKNATFVAVMSNGISKDAKRSMEEAVKNRKPANVTTNLFFYLAVCGDPEMVTECLLERKDRIDHEHLTSPCSMYKQNCTVDYYTTDAKT